MQFFWESPKYSGMHQYSGIFQNLEFIRMNLILPVTKKQTEMENIKNIILKYAFPYPKMCQYDAISQNFKYFTVKIEKNFQ